MQCGSIKQLAGALIKCSFLAHTFLINCCTVGDAPNTCLHVLSTLQIGSFIQLPESGEFLKALGLITGVAVIMAGVKQIQKIIIEIDKQERKRQQQDAPLPATLYERINHRICLDIEIQNELLARERLLALRYPKESTTKKIILSGEQISLEKKFYDRRALHKFACETGCSILNVSKHRKRSDRT